MPEIVYLDHNATTAVRPEARKAVSRAMDVLGNPSSVHGAGRLVRCLLEDARERVAALAGTAPAEVVFTSGGTEANNLALSGVSPERRLLLSAVEHASVLDVAPEAERIPVDADGVVDLAALEALLGADQGPALVSVMAANNETGVLQPVAEVCEIAHRHGAVVHCDAVQAAGKVVLDINGLGADLMTLSAHKIGGLTGAGALIVRGGLKLSARLKGGGQERGRRAGTEPFPAIAAFGAAAEAAMADRPRLAGIAALRDDFEAWVRKTAPDVTVFGARCDRLPNTSCLTMPGVDSETQVMGFDLAGIAVSAGAACSSGKVEPSHVLSAMGVSEDDGRTALRVSLGWTTTENDVESFKRAWNDLYGRLGQGHIAA